MVPFKKCAPSSSYTVLPVLVLWGTFEAGGRVRNVFEPLTSDKDWDWGIVAGLAIGRAKLSAVATNRKECKHCAEKDILNRPGYRFCNATQFQSYRRSTCLQKEQVSGEMAFCTTLKRE